MKKYVNYLILASFLTFTGVGIAGCKKQPGSTQYKGKIKKGKPIPCPVKDC